MAFIYRQWRVVAAGTAAAAMIVGAFLAAQGAGNPPIAQAATESALLSEIANRDSTGDGLPDWEKPLYGIPLDATTTDYFNLGMTDGEAVAKGLIVPIASANMSEASSSPVSTDTNAPAGAPDGTLTAAFSQDFFTLYLNAKESNGGAALTADQMSSLAQEALSDLTSSVSPTPDFKTAADIKVSGSGSDALRTYAINAEAVFAAYDANLPESELDYLQAAVNGDSGAASNLQKISAYYRNSAIGLATLPVPPELASIDLSLINSLARLAQTTSDFARVGTDPIATMLALEQYPPALQATVQAFQSIGQTFGNAGIAIPDGAPGGYFVNTAVDLAAAASSTTP